MISTIFTEKQFKSIDALHNLLGGLFQSDSTLSISTLPSSNLLDYCVEKLDGLDLMSMCVVQLLTKSNQEKLAELGLVQKVWGIFSACTNTMLKSKSNSNDGNHFF